MATDSDGQAVVLASELAEFPIYRTTLFCSSQFARICALRVASIVCGTRMMSAGSTIRFAITLLLAGTFASASAQAPVRGPTNAWQCAPADMAELCRLAEEDQRDRTAPINWDHVTPRDRERRASTLSLLRSRPLRTLGDYFHAALVMQHGDAWEDFATAHILSTRGLQLAPSDPNLQRMVAASWDRMMHAMGHGQWFGTNTFRNADGTELERGTRRDLLPGDLIELWSHGWEWPHD